MRVVIPVAAGLATGVALLYIASVVFPLGHAYTPRPGIHAEEAARIAAEDGTVQSLIGDKDAGIRTSRDWGVGGPDCPINWCAIVFVYDKSDPKTIFYTVNVNVRDERVAGIYIGRDLLIAQTKENVEEVKAFLSRYPDADAEVQVGPDGKTVTYVERKADRIRPDKDAFRSGQDHVLGRGHRRVLSMRQRKGD